MFYHKLLPLYVTNLTNEPNSSSTNISWNCRVGLTTTFRSLSNLHAILEGFESEDVVSGVF